MRTLAISDIHGCSTAFETLLQALRLQPDDTIVTLGDYVDKGPDSKGVLDRLIDLQRSYRLIPLKGNHEVEMLAALENPLECTSWLEAGGNETLASYSTENQEVSLANIPQAHWHFIENSCVDWWQIEDYIFVHANLEPDLPVEKQSEYCLFWQKFHNPAPHCSGKIMICGHTSQKDGKPVNLGHAICLDTWVYGDGWLTGLEVESGKIWQTNQQGQLKTTWIDEFMPGK